MKKLITAIAAIATSFGLFADDPATFANSVTNDICFKTNNLVVGYDAMGATQLSGDGTAMIVNWFADSLKTNFHTNIEGYEQPELKDSDTNPSYKYLAIDTDVKDPVLRTFSRVMKDSGDDNYKYDQVGITDHGVFIDTETTFTLFDTDPEAPSDSKILVWAKETEADDTTEPATPGSTNLMVTCGVKQGLETAKTNYVLNIDSVLPNGLQPETMYRLTIRADKDGEENTKFHVYLNEHQLSTVDGLNEFPSLVGQNQQLGSAGFGGTGSLKSVDLLTAADAPEFAADATTVKFTYDDKVSEILVNGSDIREAATNEVIFTIAKADLGNEFTAVVSYENGYRRHDITCGGVGMTATEEPANTVTFSVVRYAAGTIEIESEEDRDEAVLTVNGAKVAKSECGTLLGGIFAYVTENCVESDKVLITLGDSKSLGSIKLEELNNLEEFEGDEIVIDLHGCTIESNLASIPEDGGYMFMNNSTLTIMDSVGGGAIVAQTGIDLIYNISSLMVEKPTVGTISFTGKIVNDCSFDDEETQEWWYGYITLKGGRYTDKVYTTTLGDTEMDPQQEHILDGITLGESGELKWTAEKVDGYWELEPSGAQLKVVSNAGLDVVLKTNDEVCTELQVPITTAPIEVEVTATLKDHYQFVSTTVDGWVFTDNKVATYTTTIETAAESVTITAPATRAITFDVTFANGEHSTITPAAGTSNLVEGTVVAVTATAADNYEFAETVYTGWTKEQDGTLTKSYTVTAIDTVTAPNATAKPVDVTLPELPIDGVSSLAISQKVNEAWVDVGNEYVVVAIPAAGYTIDNPIKRDTAEVGVNITVTKEDVEAKIGKQTFTVTVNASNATLLTNDAPVVETSFTAAYGTVLALTATADTGYENPTIKTNGQEVTSLTITEAVTIDVAATAIEYAINVTDGTADPATFTIDGETVALAYTGTPATGESFSTWTASAGTVDGNTLTIEQGTTGEITVTPNFTNNVYAITYIYTDGTDPVVVTANTNSANFTYGIGVPSFDAAGLTYDTTKYENPQFSPTSIGTDVAEAKTVTVTFTKKQTEPIPVPQKDEDVPATLAEAGITAPEVTTVADIQALNDILKANGITDAKTGLTEGQKAHMNDTFLMSEAGITKNYIYTDGAQIKIDKVEATDTNGKWAFEVTVADGTTPIEAAKIAAKALAGSAKKATTLGTWMAITDTDIDTALKPGTAGKVTFTVDYGNGVQGFLKIDVSKTTPVTPEP